MSRAFVKETDQEDEPVVPPPPLPPGVPNYVTPAGATRLRAELAAARAAEAALVRAERPEERAARAAARARRALLEARGRTWVVLAPPQRPTQASFGCAVEVEDARGARRVYTLVGVDEVDAAAGRVSFLSPIGRALTGAAEGDVVEVDTPRGPESLEVVAVRGG